MHFTMTWNLTEPDAERCKRINNLLIDTIKKHAVIIEEPVAHFFVVKTETEAEWQVILNSVKGICEMYKGKITFIMSPPNKGGQYNGNIRDWTKVNEASK